MPKSQTQALVPYPYGTYLNRFSSKIIVILPRISMQTCSHKFKIPVIYFYSYCLDGGICLMPLKGHTSVVVPVSPQRGPIPPAVEYHERFPHDPHGQRDSTEAVQQPTSTTSSIANVIIDSAAQLLKYSISQLSWYFLFVLYLPYTFTIRVVNVS